MKKLNSSHELALLYEMEGDLESTIDSFHLEQERSGKQDKEREQYLYEELSEIKAAIKRITEGA